MKKVTFNLKSLELLSHIVLEKCGDTIMEIQVEHNEGERIVPRVLFSQVADMLHNWDCRMDLPRSTRLEFKVYFMTVLFIFDRRPNIQSLKQASRLLRHDWDVYDFTIHT